MGRATCHSPTAQCSAPKSHLPYHTLIIVHIVLNYDSDATQLGSDEDSATQYEYEEWESVSDLYGTELESDSSSHGSKPQLAPAHEWSDDCVSEKTEEEEP